MIFLFVQFYAILAVWLISQCLERDHSIPICIYLLWIAGHAGGLNTIEQ